MYMYINYLIKRIFYGIGKGINKMEQVYQTQTAISCRLI